MSNGNSYTKKKKIMVSVQMKKTNMWATDNNEPGFPTRKTYSKGTHEDQTARILTSPNQLGTILTSPN
jgi:hypothetical protein